MIPGHLETHNVYEDDEDEFDSLEDSASTEILEQGVREIDRFRTLDFLMPTYHNVVTTSCLQASMRLMMAGIIPKDSKPFMVHSRFGNFVNVRLVSFDALLLLGALDYDKTIEYLCKVVGEDPAPYVRFHVAQSLAEMLGILMAHDGLEGHREMQESLVVEEDGVITGHEFSPYDHDKPGAYGLEVARKMYGYQPTLQKEVWKLLTGYPYQEHRVLKYLLLFCDILYPPGESILHRLKFRAPTVEDIMMKEPVPVLEPAPARVVAPVAPVAMTPMPLPAATLPPPTQAPPRISPPRPVTPLATNIIPTPMKVPAPSPALTLVPTPALNPVPVQTLAKPKPKAEGSKIPKLPKAKAPAAPVTTQGM